MSVENPPAAVAVEKPGMLSVVEVNVKEGRALFIYRSEMIEDDDPWLDPVLTLISSSCTTEVHREAVDDPEMFRRRAELRVVTVWAECPAIPHDCRHVIIPEARGEVEECQIIEASASTTSTKSAPTPTTSAV